MSNNRDIVNHGAGKGDVPRTKFDRNWAVRYTKVKWGPKSDEGFVRRGNKITKRYLTS